MSATPESPLERLDNVIPVTHLMHGGAAAPPNREEMTMTPQERDVIAGIFDRLRQAANQPRDPEAERYIADRLRDQPYAPYAMAQAVYVQEQAVLNLQAQVEDLQAQMQELQARQQAAPVMLPKVMIAKSASSSRYSSTSGA